MTQTELARSMPFRSVVSTSTGLAFAAIEYLAVAGLLTVVAGRLAWLAVLLRVMSAVRIPLAAIQSSNSRQPGLSVEPAAAISSCR